VIRAGKKTGPENNAFRIDRIPLPSLIVTGISFLSPSLAIRFRLLVAYPISNISAKVLSRPKMAENGGIVSWASPGAVTVLCAFGKAHGE